MNFFFMRTSKGHNPACNKALDQEMVKHLYPYFLRSPYSSSFMDLILRFDVLWTEVLQMVNMGQKYQKGA